MRIGVLNNLRAGRSNATTFRVLDLLRGYRDVLHRETGSGAMVPEAVAEFAGEGVDLLVVNGGDGTVQRVLTEILGGTDDWRPRVAPLRGGRTNMTALDIGSRRDPVKGLRDVIDAARAGTIEERSTDRNVLRIDLGSDGVTYGMFFGVGMLYRAIQLVHRSFPDGRARGAFGSGIVTAALIARFATGRTDGVLDPDKIQVALDGQPVGPDEFVLTMASTSERLFLGMRPFWGAEPAPVRFTAVAASAQHLWRAAPGILRGRAPAWATPELGYTSQNVGHAAMSLDCGLTVDGELYHPEPDRVVRVSADDRVRFVRA